MTGLNINVVTQMLINRRHELGLSVREVAERIGCAHSTIYEAESNKRFCSVPMFLRWIDALDYKLVYEVFGDSTYTYIRITLTSHRGD
jgi:transcriptional regulator with XRE-family HTH domain